MTKYVVPHTASLSNDVLDVKELSKLQQYPCWMQEENYKFVIFRSVGLFFIILVYINGILTKYPVCIKCRCLRVEPTGSTPTQAIQIFQEDATHTWMGTKKINSTRTIT